MSRLALVLCGVLLATATANGRAQQDVDRWDPAQLRQWLAAVEDHTPGRLDAPLMSAAALNGADLRTLWVDTQVLLEIVIDPSKRRFVVPPFPGDAGAPPAAAPPGSLRRSTGPPVSGRGPRSEVRTLRKDERAIFNELAERVDVRGVNAILNRAAILHTDVVTVAAVVMAGSPTTSALGLRWNIGDGTSTGTEGMSLHWDMARMLLGWSTPRRSGFERDWYRATVAHAQSTEYFDVVQMAHGLRLFPDDPELLLLAGNEREALASPLFQAFARSVPLARSGIGSDDRELSAAAAYYKRALDVLPGFPEARMHLGRVLLLQSKPQAAASELRTAFDEVDPSRDTPFAYYTAVLLGAAFERLNNLTGAAAAYRQAIARAPDARVPRLALARIAREVGDRELMESSLARALTPLSKGEDTEPWWLYRAYAGQRRAGWLDDLRQRAATDRP